MDRAKAREKKKRMLRIGYALDRIRENKCSKLCACEYCKELEEVRSELGEEHEVKEFKFKSDYTVYVVDRTTGEKSEYESLLNASLRIGKSKAYLSNCLIRVKKPTKANGEVFEIGNFSLRIIKKRSN